MSNERKINISKWVTFAISCLTIIIKVVGEIVEIIPSKEQ